MFNWLGLIILGIVLLMVAWYLARSDAPPNPPLLRWALSLLGALALVVGILEFIFVLAGAPAPSPRAEGLPLIGVLALGSIAADPTPTPAPTDSNDGGGGYVWRYVLNAGLVLVTILSVLANYITTAQISASWLGLSDIQWHWALLIFGAATALNAAFNRTPPVTRFPTQARLAIEARVHAIRRGGSNWS